LYKDEVREVGRELQLPEELLHRHPFPGPGLAIRCLCAEQESPLERTDGGWIIPVRSVGVQGDSRSYRPVFLMDGSPNEPGQHDRASRLVNRELRVNRVVTFADGHDALSEMRVYPSAMSAERLHKLRAADGIVRHCSGTSGFEDEVWQFPVILIPVGTSGRRDSVVLRPVHSVDGMTAQAVQIPKDILNEMAAKIVHVPGISAVFVDMTHKPPGTIEWE
jgi:GMP synthase (glutamine-hydrolysing)